MIDIESGVLNINKPAGWSSARVVAFIKKILKIKKVGHCGTLDPRAVGVLIVCFGKATRFSSNLMNKRKVYRGSLRLGVTTDTGDLDGKVTSQTDIVNISRSRIESVFKTFTGQIDQIPPMHSAIKINGKKLYEIARSGKTIDRPARKVEIFKIEILDISLPEVEFRLYCSKGTYVRSFAEDIGKKLGCGAVLSFLSREANGNFSILDSLSWDIVTKMNRDELLGRAILLDKLQNYIYGMS